MKAVWKGEVLAESDHTKIVEDHHYFPPEAINSAYFQLSDTHEACPRKGKASYFHLKVGEEKNPDAAWFYPHPKQEANEIKNYVAFRKGVEVKE